MTDVFGLTHWGPYGQFKWVLMAKLRRSRVMFVSVGAGPIVRPLGRVLAKAALSLADYRSYRDDASRDYLRKIGFTSTRDRVYPDLAFGLPEAMLSSYGARSGGARCVVGLGLMVYDERYSADGPRPGTYSNYLESFADFAAWLLQHDYDIRLLLGDGDSIAIEQFRTALHARLGSLDEERVVAQPIASVQDLFAELAATDVVVATRFHNVLMAMLLAKPVIAVTFHHKCSSLMRTMKLSEYCHDIHHMDADKLIGQFLELERNRDAVKLTIGRGVHEARTAVDEQYDLMFASV